MFEPQALNGPVADAVMGPAAGPGPVESAPAERGRGRLVKSERHRHPVRRRTGPARERVAANDDVPSIGALMFALQQQPSRRPFFYAAIGTGVWLAMSAIAAFALIAPVVAVGDSLAAIAMRPQVFEALALTFVPIAIFWFLAALIWRAQELRLMAAAMTEVAVRLAEPDRMAEQSIAALGQSVRRQVAAMNDAISRAIGRAGELEVLVQNEVSALERSYDENENRIRNLIDELVSEREALAGGSERIADTLKGVGAQISDRIYTAGASVAEELSERGNVLHSSMVSINERIGGVLPGLLEKLSHEQSRLALVVEGATSNLDLLQSALDERTTRLDTSLSMRTQQIQTLMEDYTTTIDTAIAQHANTLGSRLGQLTGAIETSNMHIENVLAGRTDALDAALVERTKAIDMAFGSRMAEIDESIERSSMAVEGAISRGLRSVEAAVAQGAGVVDGAIGNRVEILRSALERHASSMGSTLRDQSEQLEKTLISGLEVLRRQTETITQQSNQTVNGLTSQGRVLRDVSEGLIGQLQNLLDRFDQQNRLVSQASSALEVSQDRLTSASTSVSNQLSVLNKDIANMTTHMAALPVAARDSSSGVRLAIQDQVRALDSLSNLSREQRSLRDMVPPVAAGAALRTQPFASNIPGVFSGLAQSLPASTPRDGWSLGDLLARASQDEGDAQTLGSGGGAAQQPGRTAERRDAPAIDLMSIASAVDPATATMIWEAHRSGNRAAITCSLYSPEGQMIFDQIGERIRGDLGFRGTIERYLGDFERILQQSDQRDPSARTSQSQILTEAGRVYLLLAHASGRLG